MIVDATIAFNELQNLGLTHEQLRAAIHAAIAGGLKHPVTGAPISLSTLHVTVRDDRTPTTHY